MLSMNKWNGKTAVVTGASYGIGAAVALELTKHGINVVAMARSKNLLEELSKKSAGPGFIHPVAVDIRNEGEIDHAFQFIRNTFRTVNILVNCAGIVRPGQLSSQDPKFIREVLDVNVMGIILFTQHAIKLMKETNEQCGHVININSMCGHRVIQVGPEQRTSMYTTSKFSVTAITETLRQELASQCKIRVTSLSPGCVETDILKNGVLETADPSIGLGYDFDGIMKLKPQDVADAIVYILSTPAHVQISELSINPMCQPF